MGNIIERSYINKNGFYTEEELLTMKQMTEEEFKQYISDNTQTLKCPPRKYAIVNCFYCVDCIRNAKNLIKDKKVK